jgi:ribonuclease P/MRP protein subunit POP5
LKRSKRRYLALKLECDFLPSEREFMDAIWASVTCLFGEVGASLSGLRLIDVDVQRKIFVVRVLLAYLSPFRASVAAVTKVAGKDASINVLAVSGTLKALYTNIN